MKNNILAFTVVFLMILTGCDSNMLEPIADDSSKQADLEAAKMALDDGNYDKTINTLNGYSRKDPEIAGLIASAYMGKAGIDLTYLIGNLRSDKSSFDIIASALTLKLIPSIGPSAIVLEQSGPAEATIPDGFIPASTIEELSVYLENAQSCLIESLKANLQNDDLRVQLGIAAAMHFIMRMGYIVATIQDVNIPMTQAAYLQVFPTVTAWNGSQQKLVDYFNSHTDELGALKEELPYVYDLLKVFIENIGQGEDKTQEFQNFLTDTLGLPEGSSTEDINNKIQSYSVSDLVTFIKNKILEYQGGGSL
jgi:hypothetical protein